ncbi:MAG TPA: sodium:solute symporter family protein [Vicinamibacterales bacterium]|jgi:Na+/proline symporter
MTITRLDWAVLVGYLIAITGIGLLAGRRVRRTNEYFLGARRFGPWVMISQSFTVGTHAEMPVALAGAVYGIGASAIWYQWKNLFITPLYWVMAPVFRRIRRTTTAEFMEDRYGPFMGAVYIVFAVCFFIIEIGGLLKGAGKVISQAIGGTAGVNEIVAAMTVMFVVYSFVGGLVASAKTDLFQGVLIIVLSFMLIPLGWRGVGGLDGMQATLPSFQFSLSTPSGIGPWVIAMLTINGLVGIMAQPHMLATVGTGRDERTCRVGMLFGNFVKRVCTVGWMFVGLITAALVVRGGTGTLADPELAFGFACRRLLFPGALGLLVASILAASMSACSAYMVDVGALFTEGFYRPRVRSTGSDGHYLWVGRISGAAITLLGVLYAMFLIESVLYTFLLTETLSTFVGIGLLGGVVWRRANRWGALASLLCALATNFVLYWLTGQRLDHWDPNVFLAALSAGAVALVLVSLVTAPESEQRLASLFDRLETSSDSAARQPLLLVNVLRPRSAVPFRGWRTFDEDLSGLAIGFALVVALVAATAWLLTA